MNRIHHHRAIFPFPVRSTAALLAAALLLAPWPGAPLAGERDHDRARQALEAGEILPLRSVIERVEADYPGQIVEVELDRDDGEWVYEIKLLREGGTLVKLELDARDGTLLSIKGRDIGHRRGAERP